MHLSDRYVAASETVFLYRVDCWDTKARLWWSAEVCDKAGTQLFDLTGTIHGLNCDEAFAETVVKAAVVDAIRERIRFEVNSFPPGALGD
jgi:hypothetical protein